MYIEVWKVQNKGAAYGGYKSVEAITTKDYLTDGEIYEQYVALGNRIDDVVSK